MNNRIDITFDTYFDTPPGKDPDTDSPTLRRYHKLLWSKPLPNGTVFELNDTVPKAYLHHHSEAGEFFLAMSLSLLKKEKQASLIDHAMRPS
jgi:hypothetical protein